MQFGIVIVIVIVVVITRRPVADGDIVAVDTPFELIDFCLFGHQGLTGGGAQLSEFLLQ